MVVSCTLHAWSTHCWKRRTFSLHVICDHGPAVARSFWGGVAMCSALPVLWMMLCFHKLAQHRPRRKGACSKWFTRGSIGGEIWCLRLYYYLSQNCAFIRSTKLQQRAYFRKRNRHRTVTGKRKHNGSFEQYGERAMNNGSQPVFTGIR